MKHVVTFTCLLLLGTLPFEPGHAAVSLVDDSGREISLPQPVRRVVTLAPHLAEMMFDIGAQDALIATVEWSDHPPQARQVPRIGNGFRIDVERIVAARPDLVLAWGSGTPAPVVEQLEALRVPVAVLTPRDLESIPRHVEWLGRATGREAGAQRVARRFRDDLVALRETYARREPLRVFYQIQTQPLFTVGAGHTITELIETCGGRNVFDDLDANAHTVGVEAVLARDPQVIIVGQYEGADLDVGEWKRWPQLAATRTGNLLSIDAERVARPTAAILEGGRALCEMLEQARANVNNAAAR